MTVWDITCIHRTCCQEVVSFLEGVLSREIRVRKEPMHFAGCREQPPRGAPWVSGLVGHFVQTWPDSEWSHTVPFLDSAVLRL